MATAPCDGATRHDAGPDGLWDVAVIGAGPAGLAAAVAAARHGATVAVLDAEPAVGGQFWRHPAPGSAADRVRDADVAPYHHDRATYRTLRVALQRYVAEGRAAHLRRHEVWAVDRQAHAGAGRSPAETFVVHAVDAAVPARPEVTVRTRRLIVATGAYDLQIPFPGWDLPGVFTAGGAQSLIKGHDVAVGARVLVAGTGPFLLSVAAGLIRRGATVPAVVEAAPARTWWRHPQGVLAAGGKIVEGARYAASLARHGVPYLTGWGVVRAHGDQALTGVTVAPIGRSGLPDRRRARRIPVDALAVGWGFVPQLELALALGCETRCGAAAPPVLAVDAEQRSSVPGVFAAGEVCGVGGAALALVEGEIAGIAAARDTRRADPRTSARAGGAAPRADRRRRRLRTFADALARVYPIPGAWPAALGDDTVVCRCEEVTAGAIRDAVRQAGAADARTVKLLARPGMGHCQGRICAFATECLAAHALGVPATHRPVERPIAAPLTLGALAADDATVIAPAPSLPRHQ